MKPRVQDDSSQGADYESALLYDVLVWPLRIALARLRPLNGATWLRIAIVATLVGLFLWGDYAVFERVIRTVTTFEQATPIFAAGIIRNFLELVLLIGFVVLFFSSLTSAIGAFFLDLDLEVYHAAPVSKLRIIVARWCKAYVQSAYVVIAFLTPLFAALATVYELPVTSVVRAVVLMLVLFSIPVSAASTVILLLVRFFPVRRVQQIAASLAILFITVAVVGVRMARPERLFSNVQTDDVMAVLRQIELPAAERYPSSWVAARVMVDLDQHDESALMLRLVATAAIALAAFLALARGLYFAAWVRSRESQSPTAIGGDAVASLFDRMMQRASGPTRALIGKELRILVRDAAQWSQLIMMIALLFLYLYNIQMMPLEGDARAILLAYLNVGMCGFVVAAIALRFAYPSVSAEGKSFWLVETAPVTHRMLLWIKATVVLAPLLLLTVFLVILGNLLLDAPLQVWLYTLPGSMLMTVTLVVLGVAMGAMNPDFRRENAMEVALSLGGFAYMAIALAYTGAMMILFARPTQYIFFRLIMGLDQERSRVMAITPLLLGVALSLSLILIPMEIAHRRLAARRER